ncbi:MAG: SlyX family protein [Pseudomonadota bacterium]
MNDSEVERRLADLESRQAFQEDAQNTLSDVLAQQARDIAALRQQIEHLNTRLREALQDAASPQREDDAPPPHY